MVFYAILVDYGIDTKNVCLLQARAFVAQGMFEQAEQLLHRSQDYKYPLRNLVACVSATTT